MTALATFTAPTGHEVRSLMVDGEPWFVAADVAKALGYREAYDLTRRIDLDDKGPRSVRTPGGDQQMICINEAGLYVAILGSQVEGAREFKRWITHEVLPAIRREGYYVAPGRSEVVEQVPTSFAEALRLAARLEEERQAAEALVRELTPAADAWHHLATADGDYSVADAAKVLSRKAGVVVGQNRLFTVLSNIGWTYRASDGRWRVKQSAVESGRLSERPTSHYHPRTGELILDPPQIRVTVKGVEALLARMSSGLAPELTA